MTDEIEKQLLKEIEDIALHPDRIAFNITPVNELKSKLEQHRQTKKWIEELIEQQRLRDRKSGKGNGETYEELKKQIGEGK